VDLYEVFGIVPVYGNTLKGYGMKSPARKDIKPGMKVSLIQKKDQTSGVLTEGTVKDILTNSPTHPHGIKVRLRTGEVGRVKKLHDVP